MEAASDICAWFKELNGPNRIDLMCRLLRMCLPLEIRFLGSCVEELAKKDYNCLREAEIKGNDCAELTKLTDIFSDVTRSKLNVYLALLHSSNMVCANILFNTLKCFEPAFRSMGAQHQINSSFAEEVVLLLTLAANHPAYTFSQKQILYDHLCSVRKLLEPQAPKDEVSSVSSSSSSSRPQHLGDISHHASPAINTHSAPTHNAVYVKDIDLRGAQWNKRHEFQIQVTWSDGEVTEVCRTYKELQSFHAELIKLFPKDSGAHKQDRQIPFFPQEKGHSHHQVTEQITKYIRQLSALPDHIVQCDHVSEFLQPTAVKQQPVSNVQSSPHTLQEVVVVDTGMNSVGVPVPTANTNTSTTNNRGTYTQVVSVPSPMSSPLPSPLSSPHLSPSPSVYSSLSASPPPRTLDIAHWLKTVRLHKYQKELTRYSLEQLCNLTDADLKAEGLTAGARKKFSNELEKIRNGQFGPNGVVINTASMARSISPSSPPVSWHTPPSCNTFLPPSQTAPPSHPAAPPIGSSMSNTGSSVDSSPACSEYSSPPPSPKLHTELLSSEETERDGEKDDVMCESPTQSGHILPPDVPTEIRSIPVMRSDPVTAPSPAMPINMVPANTNMFVPIPNQLHMYQQGLPPPGVDVKNLTELLPFPFHGGMRAPLQGNHMMDPYHLQQLQYLAPRATHIRPPRQLLKAPIIPPQTSSTTVLPAPKMMNNATGLIYENGRPAKSPSPNNGAALDIPAACSNTVSSTAMPHSDSGMLYKASPSVYMPCSVVPNIPPVQGRPLTLGVPMPASIANTKITYSLAPVTSMPPGMVVDASHKTCSHPPPPLQPSPHMVPPLLPQGPPLIHPAPNTMDTSFHSSGSSPMNTVITSASSYPAPLLPASAHPIPPINPPPGPPARNAPTPTPPSHPPQPTTPTPPSQSTPSQTPTPTSNPNCTSCGCNGHCGNSSNPASTPPTLHYNYMWQHHPGMYPGGFLPGLFPVTSNGLITPPGLPQYPHPIQAGAPLNLPNGLGQDMVYNNHHGITVVQTGMQPGPVPPFMAPFPPGAMLGGGPIGNPGSHSGGSRDSSSASSTSSNGGHNNDKAMCCNCGGTGHRAPECHETTMDSMTQAGMGQYHLNIGPKSDSE